MTRPDSHNNAPEHSPIRIEVIVGAAHPRLMEGLDLWQRLGLISEGQIRRLGQEQLSCPLPVATPRPSPRQQAIATNTTSTTSDFAPVLATPAAARFPRPAIVPSEVAQRFQTLLAEISVIWLLFLGVFMVIVSSGVLAASQWQNFTPVGQYSILLAYTLAFWLTTLWAGRKANLRLTTQMLQITTLLLVPINFWLMDASQIWQQAAGWAVAPFAALGLTAILYQLLHPTLTALPHPRLLLAVSIGLSWLHWGWAGADVPLLATYLGTIAASVALFYQDQDSPDPDSSTAPDSPQAGLSAGVITIAIATLLLIVRAVFVAQVPFAQLGLAIGICGWLLGWLSRQNPARQLWMQVGYGLLLLGWLVSVMDTPPWQAIAISGLVMALLIDALRRSPQIIQVTALFLVGLQAYGLLWRVIPVELRQSLLAQCAAIAGSTFTPEALAGIGFFPYIGVTLGFAARLRHRQPRLATQVELLTLGLGVAITLLSLANPLMRSLNLVLSTLTLAIVVQQRQNTKLIYLTHTVGLGAIAAIIDLGFPSLSLSDWAILLLMAMVGEWCFHAYREPSDWRQSGWHLGLGLAGFSYLLLTTAQTTYLEEGDRGIVWLVTPLILTGLAQRRSFLSPRQTAGLSTIALILVQFLTFEHDLSRLLSLGAATALMLLNTRTLPTFGTAGLTLAFGLSFAAASVWQGFGDRLTVDWVANLGAIAILLLWLMWDWLNQRNSPLSRLYAQVSDSWAIVLSLLHLLLLTFGTAWIYLFGVETTAWLGATGLITGAIAYRNWRSSSDLGFYGIAWGVELVVVQALRLANPAESWWEQWAIVNLVLGLLTQVAGDIWVSRLQRPYRYSWHLIPMLYAVLGLALVSEDLTATTGLYTLAAALVGIGIGRRQPDFQPLTYLSLFVISLAAYELVIYQLLQAPAGRVGDGVVVLAALGVALAVGYRSSCRWLLPYLRLEPAGIRVIAHLHWLAAAGLLLLALLLPLSLSGHWLWVGITAILTIDGIWQGRSQPVWIYAGILAATGTIAHLLYLLIPNTSDLIGWAGAIAAVFAYVLYSLPWGGWGWRLTPWRRSALVLPGAIVVLTVWSVTIPSLLITAAFYAWLAKARSQVRLSYLSLLLADWAILRWLWRSDVTEPLWYMAVLGGSLLYVAQIDPSLRSSTEREKRHLLRGLAVGLICLTAFYQSESDRWIALFTLGLGIGLILAGLMLRIRAFLYIGTATFILQILRQVWLLISDYSLLLWAIGIVVGLAFIWIAATFEARRSQMTALMQYWMSELEAWD